MSLLIKGLLESSITNNEKTPDTAIANCNLTECCHCLFQIFQKINFKLLKRLTKADVFKHLDFLMSSMTQFIGEMVLLLDADFTIIEKQLQPRKSKQKFSNIRLSCSPMHSSQMSS